MNITKYLGLPLTLCALHINAAIAAKIDYSQSSQNPAYTSAITEKTVFIALHAQSVSEFSAQYKQTHGRIPNAAIQKKHAQKIQQQQDSFAVFLKTLNATHIKALHVSANGFKCKVLETDLHSIRNHPLVKKVTLVPIAKRQSIGSLSSENLDSPLLETRKLAFTGKNQTIAIIGTGINYELETFGGKYAVKDIDNIKNDPRTIEEGSFPTAKFIAGIDLAGEDYEPGESAAIPDSDPFSPYFSHETLVAAIAAGEATPNNPHAAGVAPDAKLIAIKVFGEQGSSTDLIADAIEFALDPNQDGNIDDRADIINLSIASNFSEFDNVDALAAKNATDLGVVVVASAGNAGDTPFIIGSASVDDSVIAVGSHSLPVYDEEAFQAKSVHIEVNTSTGSKLYPVQSLDSRGRNLRTPFTAEVVLADPLDTCAPLQNNVKGKVVIFNYKSCPDRANNQGDLAATAGALASIHIREENDFLGFVFSDIPSFQIAAFFGQQLLKKQQEEKITITFDAKNVIFNTLDDYKVSDFSSRGPASGNAGFKPDLLAQGEDIRAGDSPFGDSGTSFSAPFVAGVAAALLEKRPSLLPRDVKAMLQNSTTPSRIFNTPEAPFYALDQQGVGRIQAKKALNLQALAFPAGISFGAFNPVKKTAIKRTLTVKNLSNARRYFEIKHTPRIDNAGISLRHPRVVHVPPHSEKNITITLVVDPAKLTDDEHQNLLLASDGWLTLSDDTDTLQVGYMAFTEPASNVNITQENTQQVSLKNNGHVATDIDVYTNAMYFDYANPGDESLDDFPVDFGFRLAPLENEKAVFNFVYFFEQSYNTLFNKTHAIEMFLPDTNGDFHIAALFLSPDTKGHAEHPELNLYGEVVYDPENLIESVNIHADYNSNWLQIEVITKNRGNALFLDEPIGVRYIQPDISHVTAEFSGAQQVKVDKPNHTLQPRARLNIATDQSDANGFLFIKKNTIQNQIIDLN